MSRTITMLAVLPLLLAGTGRAETITYMETFAASGTLGSQSFNNVQVTFTGTGDTANAFGSGSFFQNSLTTATVTIDGIAGTATLTDNTNVFRNGVPSAGFVDDASIARIATNSSLLATYDLTTPITASGPAHNDANIGWGTSDGTLTFTSFGATSTFTATLGTPVSGVPEPATLTLLGIGAVGMMGYAWRRRRQQAA